MGETVNDPELLAAFFEESGETLTTVANLFIDLEQRPGDLELVQAIFRPVHSLKGNSAFFGFLALKRLAHEMETVLDLVRTSRLVASGEVISTLLAGLDELRAIIDRLRAGAAEVVDQPAYDGLIERQRIAARVAGGDADDGIARAIAEVDVFLTRVDTGLTPAVRDAIGQLLIRARRELGMADPARVPRQPVIDPRLTELRGLLATVTTENPDPASVARMGVLVEELPGIATDERGRGVATELLDAWRTCIGAAGYNEILRDFLASQLDILVTAPGFHSGDQPTLAPPQTSAIEQRRESTVPVARQDTTREVKSETIHREEKGKSIRVAEARIDTFLHHVGELLVVGDMFSHLLGRVRQIDGTHKLVRDFRRANDTFAQLSAKLQGSIMSIRKVPVRPQLAKVPRIVRDVAVAKGKDIVVRLSGEEVEIDKSLIELLDAPLTHIARNAADHGIEIPEKRIAAGKPAQGTVSVSVQETDAGIVLSVSDDGAGLDLGRIRAKAEALGLIAPGAELTQHDIINLIFASGLSTADQVTDVSGRGVGMDVVRRMIDEAGGAITIDTSLGKGSTFRLTLPKGVTTQIMAGFLVRAGGQVLVLPIDRVCETFRLRRKEIIAIPDSTVRVIIRQETALPVVALTDLLGMPSTTPPDAVVTIEANHRRLAIEVEAVLGVRKVVLRTLDGLPRQDGFYAGAALLGDGTVALILDPDGIATSQVDAANAG